jgi:hypothetical protein
VLHRATTTFIKLMNLTSLIPTPETTNSKLSLLRNKQDTPPSLKLKIYTLVRIISPNIWSSNNINRISIISRWTSSFKIQSMLMALRRLIVSIQGIQQTKLEQLEEVKEKEKNSLQISNNNKFLIPQGQECSLETQFTIEITK